MTKVKIVGHGNELFELQNVKDAELFLGGKYYWKHDTNNLFRVPVSPNKYRLFRKESGLLLKAHDGKLIRKSDAIVTEEGVILNPFSPEVVYVNGKPTLKVWCTQIDGQYYLKTDPNIILDYEDQYILKKNAIQLAPRIYGDNM